MAVAGKIHQTQYKEAMCLQQRAHNTDDVHLQGVLALVDADRTHIIQKHVRKTHRNMWLQATRGRQLKKFGYSIEQYSTTTRTFLQQRAQNRLSKSRHTKEFCAKRGEDFQGTRVQCRTKSCSARTEPKWSKIMNRIASKL